MFVSQILGERQEFGGIKCELGRAVFVSLKKRKLILNVKHAELMYSVWIRCLLRVQ